MNPEIKALWLTALRSGDYKQGQGVLRDGADNFCCLGVLTDLAVKAGVLEDGVVGEGGVYRYKGEFAITEGTLIPSVAEWAGLYFDANDSFSSEGRLDDPITITKMVTCCSTCEPREEENTFHSLASLNDMAKYDFNQIADVIEEQF